MTQSQIIAIQFFHFNWHDLYYVLTKHNTYYTWSKMRGENPISFEINGDNYTVFDKIPNWIKIRRGIDSFAYINENYKDIPLIDDWYVYYSKEELPIFNKKLSESDIRNEKTYKLQDN